MIDSALMKAALERGAVVIDRGNGHIQIKGSLLVNYYPASRFRSAYVAGTNRGKKYVTADKAVEMAFTAPPITLDRSSRKKNSRAKRFALLKTIKACRWCQCPLTLDNSTLEHVIPLARGGLDNANNRTLACKPCNEERAHNMPELTAVTPIRTEVMP